MSRVVYYVGGFWFPDARAGSHRVRGNALAIQGAGLSVYVVGGRNSTEATAQEDVRLSHEGIPYSLVDQCGPRSAPRLLKLVRYLQGGRRLVRWLRTHARGDAAALILFGGYSRYLCRLIPLARSWDIPLVVDAVEWYDPSHCLGGRFGPQRWDVEISMRLLIPSAKNVIAISSFLEEHFRSRGSLVLRVPPLVDVAAEKWQVQQAASDGRRLQLAFVGTAQRKDLLINAILGLALLGKEVRACQLVMVGPSWSELVAHLGRYADVLERLSGSLRFVGTVPHREALRFLGQAHFSVLLRPDARYAHAGFPTKLVESLTMGVPPICNLTSDIGLYVQDGQEGLVIDDCSPEAFAAGVRRALALSQDERVLMRMRARRRAEASFDYHNWIDPLGQFMRQVIGGEGSTCHGSSGYRADA